MNKRLILVIIFSILLSNLPGKALAYYESATLGDLKTKVSPQNPGINQKTTITLSSYLMNIDACNIIWSENNQTAKEGTGQKSFSFITGDLGQTTLISANLNCNNNQVKKDWVFQTNDIEFLISADTYTPPFYKGGSRATSKSNVKILALPQIFNTNGEPSNNENLIYRWTKDGKNMPTSSGYGKNSLTIQTNDLVGGTSYKLEVLSLLGEIKATKSVTINIENPKIIIYENKPLLGTQYQKGLTNLFNLEQNEITLIAEPFFFSNLDITNDSFSFNWTMNGKKINTDVNDRSIILRQDTNQTGEALIGLQIINLNNVFSSASEILKINFNQKDILSF